MILKPRPLKKGDKVSIIAPSSPISSMAALKRAAEVFERNGLELSWGPNITRLRSDCWHAAPIRDRVKEIEDAFLDQETQAVWAAEGGYGASELLPFMPYGLISRSHKAFIGMSDITSLNCGILARSGLANFSGPNIRCRDDKPMDPESLDLCIKLLMQDSDWQERPWEMFSRDARCVCPGIVRGPVIGGNLTVFSGLIGTPYMPDCDGAVLFFEDIHAGGYEVSQCLNHLDLAGILGRASGVVFGEFCKKIDRGDQDICIEDVIVRKFANRVPCAFGVNFSHGATCATIPLGCEVSLDAENRIVSFGNPFQQEE